MSELKIYRQSKDSDSVKPMSVYVDTHEKLAVLSRETGISMVKILKLCVDYAVPRVLIVDQEDEQI